MGAKVVLRLSIAVFAVAAASPALAQEGGETGGVIVGVAVDSIYGAPLRGAIIRVGETGSSGISDNAGRFRITGVPRGSHRVQVVHPLLDTLRLALRTTPRDFGDSTELVIATPSAATVAAVKCPAEDRSTGSAMAVGFVTVAGTEEAVAGATVRIEWIDYEVVGKRLITRERSQTAVTGEDGSYKMCGVPPDLETGIFVVSGSDTTATLRRNFSPGLAIASFKIAPPSQALSASIAGKVVDTLGRAVEGARIATDDGQHVAISRTDGTFELSGVRPGSRGVNVRRLGFHPISQPVDVPPEGAKGVEIEMPVYVPVLETVRISARRDFFLERVGFTSRSKSTPGRFLGPEEIARRNPYYLNDLLRTIPMLRTYTVDGRQVVTGRRGECLRYFVDGHRWFENGDSPDQFYTGREIGAIEVYTSNSAPPQFSERERDGSSCSIVLVWTKWKLRM